MAKKRRVKRVKPGEREADRKRIKSDWRKSITDKADRVQTDLVYRWQGKALHFGNACDWTLMECERFIAYIWHSYFGTRATPPRVNSGRGVVSASATRFVMTLPIWARNRNIILHELAHALIDATTPPDDRFERGGRLFNEKLAHGPRFVRLEIELLVAFSTHDRDMLIKSAREYGLTVARRTTVPKRKSCEETIAACRKKHYHSMGNDLADWMKKGSPRIVYVKGKTWREYR